MSDPDQTETLAEQRRRDAAGATAATPGGVTVLGGRYALTSRIASGGMAAVWRGHDEILDRTVAVKVLHDHLAADDGFRERFRREAIAAAKLTHPNVVNLYDTGADGRQVYLVMEFVDGPTLKDVMADLGQLAPGQAASIGEKIARALAYAHERGLVHRDVKPANILIGADGVVKVADFGIAKAEEGGSDLTKTGMVLGTAAYVAPEQITGANPVDGRADQYALGCMLYEALAGRQPFKGDTPIATAAQRLEGSPTPLREVRPDVPAGLDAVINRSMARHPEDRFSSAEDMADALAAFADADTTQTRALATTTRPRTPIRRGTPPMGLPAGRRASRVVPLLVVLLLLGAAIGIGLASGRIGAPQLSEPQDQEPTEPAAPAARPVVAVTAGTFDPEGDGSENDDELSALFDSDPSTTWRTDRYNSAEFGNLKQGVGIVLALEEPTEVSGLEGLTTTPGISFEVRVADDVPTTLDGWQTVASHTSDGEQIAVDFPPTPAGAVLVWIVAPLPAGNRAEFAELTLLGAGDG